MRAITNEMECPHGHIVHAAGLAIALLVLAAMPRMAVAAAQSRDTSSGTYSVLYSFLCEPDGANPYAPLVRDSAGNLYGTTFSGGVYDWGTVFKLTPGGTEMLLHSFEPPHDGQGPEWAGLIIDARGNLYGTTPFGGEKGAGAVYELTPDGVETLLYSFSGNGDGNEPVGGLVRDPAGSLYGTTEFGGPYQTGVVFKLNSGGGETVLHDFGCCFGPSNDGAGPVGTLVRDPAGTLYGTTSSGGEFGLGTVFELAPDGTEAILHSFAGPPNDGSDGGGPTLLRDPIGNLYGTTVYGGSYNGGPEGLGYGTIFKVSASGSEATLFSFSGRGSGGYPVDGLAGGASGSVFGTSGSGGSPSCIQNTIGCGVLLELTPAGKERILHEFGESAGDGRVPSAGVIQDSTGNLYGTTYYGGAYGCGTVFKYTP
jgi:uncharacterized repeat protein (TIGR03803 family)